MLLQACDWARQFPGRVQVLHGVSIEVDRKPVGLFGPNGHGIEFVIDKHRYSACIGTRLDQVSGTLTALGSFALLSRHRSARNRS